LPSMMMVAALIGGLSSVVGLYLSFYLSVASGAAVVLTATVIFMLAFLFAPARGLLPRWWHARVKTA
jgi:manganese/iron transport system permease protein